MPETAVCPARLANWLARSPSSTSCARNSLTTGIRALEPRPYPETPPVNLCEAELCRSDCGDDDQLLRSRLACINILHLDPYNQSNLTTIGPIGLVIGDFGSVPCAGRDMMHAAVLTLILAADADNG